MGSLALIRMFHNEFHNLQVQQFHRAYLKTTELKRFHYMCVYVCECECVCEREKKRESKKGKYWGQN